MGLLDADVSALNEKSLGRIRAIGPNENVGESDRDLNILRLVQEVPE